ncbi:MAG: hypothetical protein AAB725_02215 [Patescibacteria group bacterium]
MRTFFSVRHFFTSVGAILLSVLMVALVAYGASTMDTASVGSGTSTPGAALGVKGSALVEGQLWVDSLVATSTSFAYGFGTTSPGADFSVVGGAIIDGGLAVSYIKSTSTVDSSFGGSLGVGTTTPGAQFAVDGLGLFNGMVVADSLVATSTSATSTLKWSLDVATSSMLVDGNSGRMAIGATTTADGDVMRRALNPDPALTISGTGNAESATGTLYLMGEGGTGGELVIKSSDGNNCVSLMATTGALDPVTDTGGTQTVALLVSAKVVPCPR